MATLAEYKVNVIKSDLLKNKRKELGVVTNDYELALSAIKQAFLACFKFESVLNDAAKNDLAININYLINKV